MDWTDLHSYYDGDGLRVKKTENNSSLVQYYLRSTLLGGNVIAELNYLGGWQRGYVYTGRKLLAVQQGGVFFVHEDPITKSKRVTNTSGAVQSTVELDPWGADTSHSSNSAFQPRKFTTYERDANGSDDAMMRRYNRWHSRFDQPDPFAGSYDITNPQSLNRYAYVGGDPVNFTDPTGLLMAFCTETTTWDGMTLTVKQECTIIDDNPFGNGRGGVLNPQTPRGGGGRTGGGRRPTPTPKPKPTPTPKPTPDQKPPEKTQEQKQKEYQECYHEEMKPAMEKLEKLMNDNLNYTMLSALPGGGIAAMMDPRNNIKNLNVWGAASNTLKGMLSANVGIGTSLAILPQLYNWYAQLQNFDRDVFTPAMKSAAADCKQKVGL